jgi:tetratricopeptide (TPR) repeat protein
MDHFERPENGAVSDDGTFIFNDWTFYNGHGIFYAFNENGTPLLKKDFNLNLINNGISDNGHYAVCQAANSDHDDDGGKLLFFDLKEKRILWKKHMETGWANWYKFDTEKEILSLSYSGGHEYRYTFKGEFIDSDKYIKDRLNSDIGYEFLNAIKEIREQIENCNSSYNYDDVIIMLGKGAKRFKDPDTRARIHRNIGEIYHIEGLFIDAIFHLEKAYELNPKVGVKRLLDKLKKSRDRIT